MSTMHQDREITAPTRYPEHAPFWQAAGEGRLLIMHCRSCDRPYWYPRPRCPRCGGDATEYREASGRGTVYSVSVTRRAGPVPYAIAYVTLDEGITMMSNIVDCDLDAVRIGDRVQVVFKPTESGPPVPMFRPIA